jgi:hypothetical protein
MSDLGVHVCTSAHRHEMNGVVDPPFKLREDVVM